MANIRHFFRWLKKSIQYAIFLWDDEDWDYEYLLRLIEFKLRRMEEDVRHGHHVGCERDAQNIRIARLLIIRIMHGDYTEPDIEAYFKKYEGRILGKHEPRPEDRQLRRAFLRQDYRKNYDHQYLFKHLNRHIRRWWT